MKKIAKIVILFVILLSVSIYYFFANKKQPVVTYKSLINISDLSEDFMVKYFDDMERLQDNKENMLIVTSPEALEDSYGATEVVNAPNNQYFLQYETEEDKNKALEKLNESEDILYVGENITYELTGDTYNSWGITKTGLDAAIKQAQNKDLEDITVAVIDTGCDVSLFDTYFDDKLKGTYNVLDSGSTVTDNVGHGTHIAGTIAEGTPDNVKVFPIKVSDSKTLSNSDIISAINYVIYNTDAKVINMSFAGEGYDTNMYVAIEAANENNIISVAAAGNDGSSTTKYPAGFNNTISISAVDEDLNLASFSNYGNKITFASPGDNIVSINGTGSGTSMATPHAVSAVAILKSYNKELTLAQTIELLKKHAVDLGTESWDQYFGYGLISFVDAKFCNGNYCDTYGVFSEAGDSEIESIEVNPVLTTYNYGSLNNILTSELTLHFGNGNTYTREIWEYDGVELSSYDPYSTAEQTITIMYDGVATKFKVTNPKSYESGWEYSVVNSSSVELTKYKDNNKGINILYFPEKIDGYNVVSLESKVFDSSVDISSFEKVILSKKITNLGKSSFTGASKLKEVISLADSIAVGEGTFSNLANLTTFEGTISTLGNSAFASCTLLDNITLLDSITTIPNQAFNGCTSLKTINIPSQLVSIGDYAFGSTRISKLDIPNDVTTVGDYAFYGTNYLENVTILRGVTSIGTDAFKKSSTVYKQDGSKIETVFYLYSDSYAKTYAVSNSINYESMNITYINVNTSKTTYTALDKVSNSDINGVEVYYDYGKLDGNTYIEYLELLGRKEEISEYTISYANGDSLKFGDMYYIVNGKNASDEAFEKRVDITVNKAQINYVSSGGNYSYDGNQHGITIILIKPTKATIKYMDSNGDYTLDEMPKYQDAGTYTTKFKISYDENYEDVYDEETVTITSDPVINDTTDYEGIYDGKSHSINLDIKATNYTVKYSVGNKNYDLTTMPTFKDVGSYVVNYQIIKSGVSPITATNTVKIYGIKNIDSSVTVKDNLLIIKNNNSFENLKGKITTYAKSTTYSHYNNSRVIVSSDLTKTGDIISVRINDSKDFEYLISVIGDVNADGKISSADYVKIRKHIMKSEIINGNVYTYAADVNSDATISSADYVRIRKYIMNGGSL
ncbi:MAG: leucine-rich repeat protein [Bacilli bacterium]|nr:leucine-rich repeat protein [Bacilli bacterium]